MDHHTKIDSNINQNNNIIILLFYIKNNLHQLTLNSKQRLYSLLVPENMIELYHSFAAHALFVVNNDDLL